MWQKYKLIKETTIAQLSKRDLTTQKGNVKTNKLKQEFDDFYSSTQLKQLVIDMDNNNINWLTPLCRRGSYTIIPIRFILFADFLAGSLKSFIKLLNEQEQLIERKKRLYNPPNGYEDKLVQYRRRWLDACDKNPNGCRTDLQKIDNPAYVWLIRHDIDWLLKNSPPIKKQKGKTKVKDWAKIDNELESLVENAVYKIKNSGGKPEQINITNIRRYIRPKVLLKRNYKLLPKTMYRIGQNVESIYDYRLRKIEWAQSELEREGKIATPRMILQKSGIRTEDWNIFRHLLTS